MYTLTVTPTYSVKTATYEGPFDLLLELIEKRKLFINDISLSQVTDDFLIHLKALQGIEPNILSAFIVIASTLILIKSRSLLPNFSLTIEEEKDIGDLEKRLQIYRAYIVVGEKIKKQYGKNIAFEKRALPILDPLFTPTAQITRGAMHEAIARVLNNLPKKEVLPQHEIRKVMSIEEMLDKLSTRMQTAIKSSFRDFVGVDKPVTKEEKVLVIVGFLAMLELVRQGIMDVLQHDMFGEIEMSKVDL